MKQPTVYIPQEPRRLDPSTGLWTPLYDLSPALRFGRLQVLLPHGPTLLDTELVVVDLKNRLQDYSDGDYIMCIGDPVLIAATVLVAGKINNGVVTLLQYNRSSRQYNAVTYRS